MTIIKGYVLRQDALLRMVERDLIVEKSRRGRASKGDVAAAADSHVAWCCQAITRSSFELVS
jgi:hypothetical protein